MASVFLSYDHADETRAAWIAAALENAGHSVWWDRHIHGGEEYNSKIESAVDRADFVVVLWSKRSIRSAWVRDEAAEGRDQSKLVPLLLDAVKPPMGFRQYQTIDLTRRKGSAGDAALAKLLRALDPARSHAADGAHDGQPAQPWLWRLSSPKVASLVGLVLAAVALLLWQPWRSESGIPSVTVVSSDATDSARSLAGNLLVQLGSLQAADPDALQLVEPGSGAKAHLTFKVGRPGEGGDPRAQLSLVNGAGTLLWSREFVQPGGSEPDLRQQLAYSAAQVLRCATEAMATTHRKLELQTLKHYLNGCADFSTLVSQNPRAMVSTFKKVTDEAPGFRGGWAKLLLAQIDVVMQSDLSDPAAGRDMRTYIAGARKRHPNMTEAYLAESWIQTPRPIKGWMRFTDEAVRRDPHHPEALEMHSLGILHVGRMREAVSDARGAVQFNALSPSTRESLINALLDSGLIESARNELRSAERLWPGTTNLLNLRFTLEYRYGDPNEATRLLQAGELNQTPPGAESFLRARIAPSPTSIERAVNDARNHFRSNPRAYFSLYVQALAALGRTEDAIDALLTVDPGLAPGIVVSLFRSHMSKVRQDPRFMSIAQRYGLVEYWQQTGIWADFCLEPDLHYDCKAEAAKLVG